MSASKMIKLALLIISSLMITDLIAIFFFFTISAATQKEWVAVLCTILDMFFLAAIIHGQTWREGQRDRNRVKFGHMEKNLYIGLFAGLLASVPGLIVYILYVSTVNSPATDGFYLAYLLYNATFFEFIALLKSNLVVLAVFLLPIPVFSTIGYIQGYHGIYTFEKLIYKKDSNKKA